MIDKNKPPTLPDDGIQDPEYLPYTWKAFRGLPNQEPWRHILAALAESVDPLYYSRHLAPTYLIGRDEHGCLLVYTYIDEDAARLNHQIGPRIVDITGGTSVRFYDTIPELRAALADEPWS